jgi:hypothetical protein
VKLPTPPLNLDGYLEACTERYTACIDSLDRMRNLDGLVSTARFHYLKLDSNGRPRWEALAKNLAYHILYYCFAVQKRQEARTHVDLMELRDEARQFFREESRSGEAGEMLLYFLQEAVLGAPQMVSKISLKTNPKLETFGSDGIHMKWHRTESKFDLYFGEAKLHQNLRNAVTDAVKSISGFHENGMEEFELRMVTRHFKHADDAMKETVLKYVKTGTAAETVRINHACLLGYDWDAYASLPEGDVAKLGQIFRERYEKEADSIQQLLQSRFAAFQNKRLRFEIFVLPFTSVEKFREAFLEAL